jgi:hypothetical protein
MVLRTTNSVLDVPYAIAHGLLTLHENHRGDEPDTQVHLLAGQLKSSDNEGGTYVTLSSPVNRAKPWREALSIYRYRIDPNGELASVLRPSRKYTIRLAGQDLGVKWWAYGDGDPSLFDEQSSTTAQASEPAKLVSGTSSSGKASFAVVSALSLPPETDISMRLCGDEENTSDNADDASILEISVLNKGTKPVAIQPSGHQKVLVPWGPFQPEEQPESFRSSVQITDTAAVVVLEARKPGPIRALTVSNLDRRPKLETLMTLVPGEPLVVREDIGMLLAGLADGRYRICLEPRGVWWCCEDMMADEGDDGRVPRRLFGTWIQPLMLSTEDFVEVRIEDGRVVK